jgi:regulator of protease activity HflC (stomatin/prohibitin superfamily)
VVAQIMSAGPRERGFGAPVRAHFGIDFSRSWALAYVARVFWPMLAGLGVLAWGLTGVVLVPMENRAIYERFGAPVRVLHPGLHLVLPWPLGATRRQDFGAVHALALAGPSAVAATLPRAEDLAPPEADRLWETAHPGEVTLAIASASGAKQSFQSVSADIRLLYRVGLSDAQAVAASYSTADPEALVQAVGGRVVAAYYADRTLDLVLGARREAMAEQLRAAMQAELDAMGAGLEMVAVVIEAIHPPAGAAEAYHFVRAAEIQAQASIASERGNAIVIRSQSAQYAATQVDAARATAAETLGAAQTTLARFTADRDAAKAGGRAFLLERYFTDLSGALARAPKTIIDHRLNWPEAPVLDLRPLAGERPTTGNGE